MRGSSSQERPFYFEWQLNCIISEKCSIANLGEKSKQCKKRIHLFWNLVKLKSESKCLDALSDFVKICPPSNYLPTWWQWELPSTNLLKNLFKLKMDGFILHLSTFPKLFLWNCYPLLLTYPNRPPLEMPPDCLITAYSVFG